MLHVIYDAFSVHKLKSFFERHALTGLYSITTTKKIAYYGKMARLLREERPLTTGGFETFPSQCHAISKKVCNFTA